MGQVISTTKGDERTGEMGYERKGRERGRHKHDTGWLEGGDQDRDRDRDRDSLPSFLTATTRALSD